MLHSLSRIFQPSPAQNSERSRLPNPGADVDPEAGLSNGALRLTIGARHSDSTPLLARHPSSQASLRNDMDSPRPGPSHVSWKTPHSSSPLQDGRDSPSSSRTMPMWGTQGEAPSMIRSTSSPSLLASPLSTTSASHAYRPTSVGKRSSLSVTYAVESAYASDDSDGESTRSTRSQSVPKQLSPIHETQPYQRQMKLSTDSAPRTPDSTRTFDRIGGSHSPAHSAFLNRPLKRSTSQTSTSTFRSNVSIAAPAIPPLDLRPNFQNAMGVQHGPNSPALLSAPRKSRLAPPALPTVVGSPRQVNKVSVIYEDGSSARTGSFMTAPSLYTPDAERDSPIFVARDYAASTNTEGTDTEETDATQRPSRSPALPEGLLDVPLDDAEMGLRPTSRASLRPSTPGSLSTERRSFVRPSRSTSPGTESFLQRRWLKGMSFGSDRFVLPPSAQKGKRKMSHACILFWLGFIAPWCWLIGGWLLTSRGEVGSDGLSAEIGPVLPLWHKGRKRGSGSGQHRAVKAKKSENETLSVPEKVKDAAERRIKAKSWYPLVAPSLESLAPSTTSGISTRELKRCLPSSRGVDPWIQRCRVAAAASGVLIFAAFVVAIVLIAGVRM
ncbi:hypothetical protein PYCCODRAFT_804175 [Trametes coccinea BRFM310]|uniref:Uncharacterized protein n=1 Tax=Trametes coccinea (strain BRFM310) TaxID=1353009 RepID=A0A1Y2IF28_TRAC3|nr:hypothetical protein PYCCODRAFT_804175 [Trametes coccinea BRFM310]